MINYLVKRFVPNSEDVDNIDVRKRYGVLCAVLGIICNFVLFIVKIFAGWLAGSIAIVSDAFNNLSDMGSSLVMMIGSKVGGKRADSEHPYGHGRAEYISALIISFLIIYFGTELLKNSVGKMINPSESSLSVVSIVILAVTIPVKIWMWTYNKKIGKRTNSSILLAAASDSISDVFATTAVLASAVIAPFVSFPVDAIIGIVVSTLIIKTGIDIAKETVDRLLGEAPSTELADRIEAYIVDEEHIIGMHGLMIHDYGPGCKIASVHAEVFDNLSLIDVHDMIDEIEHKILEELSVDIVIHTDPVPQNKRLSS